MGSKLSEAFVALFHDAMALQDTSNQLAASVYYLYPIMPWRRGDTSGSVEPYRKSNKSGCHFNEKL